MQLLVAIARAGKTYQAKACIVDDKLRLGALRRQTLADQMRGARLEKIGCNDDRRAPVEAISSASAFSFSSLRATNANSWPWRAKIRASARPIPAEAPVTKAMGRSSLIGTC